MLTEMQNAFFRLRKFSKIQNPSLIENAFSINQSSLPRFNSSVSFISGSTFLQRSLSSTKNIQIFHFLTTNRTQPFANSFLIPRRAYSNHSDKDALKNLMERYKDSAIKDPKFFLAFNCKICTERNHNLVSKISLQKGTVLIRCNGCKNLHLICDHLNWFGEGKQGLEQVLAAKGISFSDHEHLLQFPE